MKEIPQVSEMQSPKLRWSVILSIRAELSAIKLPPLHPDCSKATRVEKEYQKDLRTVANERVFSGLTGLAWKKETIFHRIERKSTKSTEVFTLAVDASTSGRFYW